MSHEFSHHVSTCPVCYGTKRQIFKHEHPQRFAGFDKVTGTIPCQNCGGQYQFSAPLGLVKHDRQNQPCKHKYSCESSKNSLHTYKCIHCDDVYQIDSGD